MQESWAEAIKKERSEVSIRAHLEGRLKALKPICGEGVYNKLAADIRTVRQLLLLSVCLLPLSDDHRDVGCTLLIFLFGALYERTPHTQRKHDGIQIDTNILQMDELQVMVR